MENNILIAEFMGMSYGEKRKWDKKKGWTHTVHSLDQFQTSWNWLMPVVGKISEVAAGGITYDVQNTLLVADIEKTYDAIVFFIKWYNERRK